MRDDYDVVVFVGRFQPFHLGHQKVLEHARSISNRVIVLVGSSNSARTVRNPFTFEERKNMIEGSVEDTLGLTILPLNDHPYDDKRWIEEVQSLVRKNIIDKMEGNSPGSTNHGLRDIKIGLIGHSKDDTSYYLDLFPSWERVSVPYHHMLDSTKIREAYFDLNFGDMYYGGMSPYVRGVLEIALRNPEIDAIAEEYQHYKKYKETAHQYPRIEQTVDAVVMCLDQVLLVKRKYSPGKGLWALPGGFVNPTERLMDAAHRELLEETQISVSPMALRTYTKFSEVFDHPNRSGRGRVITQAYYIHIPPANGLPTTVASDDAEDTAWIHISELDPAQMFEDHYHIIHHIIQNNG